MATLDCESFESALTCVCELYSAKNTEVVYFLSGLDLEQEHKRDPLRYESDDLLIRLFESRFGVPSAYWDHACWFHLTRVRTDSNFSEGILPLNEALPRIWESIISTVSSSEVKTNLLEMRATGVPDYQYNLKTNGSIHWGPFAMLVKEIAFHAEAVGNHDYLKSSEIVEDICNGYLERFGYSIHGEVLSFMKRCIVKFGIPEPEGNSLLAPVLHYCLCKARNEKLHHHTNTCYDAGGNAIPYAAIHRVECP